MILAAARWVPPTAVKDTFTGQTGWRNVRPAVLKCTFVAPRSGLIAVSALWGINTGGRAWAGIRSLGTGEILPGSAVLLSESTWFKGAISYDLVPVRVTPNKPYRVCLAVRANSPQQTIELAAGYKHPIPSIEIYG